MSNQWEKARQNGADPASGMCSPPPTVRLPILTSRQIGMRLGMAFGLLVAILMGIGYLGLSRMDQINAHLNEVLGRQWAKLQLAREALTYSNRNSRITMEIFLLNDRRVIGPLLADRAQNTQKISELMGKIESQCDSPEEKRLLAAVTDARVPYIASYLRALHLLVDQGQQEESRTIMVRETTPALYKYHDAWTKFMTFQMERMDKAAQESRARYATARALVLLLIALAVIVAVVIAFFVTLKMTEEMSTRIKAELELHDLNAELERRVEQRAHDLAHSNQQLTREIAERKSAEGQLHLQAAALDAAANSIVITDVTGRILWVNSAFTHLTGYRAEEVKGQNPRLLRSGKQPASFYANLWKTVTSGDSWRGEVTNRRKDGSLYDEEMTITPVRAEGGEITYFVAMKQDITGRKLVEQALQQAEQKYRAIFQDAVVGIFQTTPEGRYVSVNPALAQMYGYDSPEQLMTEVTDIARQLFVEQDRYGELTQLLERHGMARNFEYEIHCKDGGKKWVLANVRAVRGADGKILRREGTVQDIAERKAAEGQVQFLAYYDALTGLPNRSLLQDRLAKALASARRHREKVALLFFDLDRFKTINDSLGHPVGDLLLKEVAERLKKWGREQDTVARLGGDEFVVVLTGVKDAAGTVIAADRLMKAISKEITVQGHLLSTSCSLGISVFPDHGTDGETLLKNADTAMYCAKENGRNNFQFFTQDMNGRAVEQLTLETSLRLALENGELFLEYQPQVDLATENIIGAEALLRWRHPELGLVPPNKFIPIAENSGLIIPIGEWVLRTACAQARQWQDEGLPALPVAVNVSAVQFRQDRFLQVVTNVLDETGLAPRYLELELTEGLLLSNSEVMLSMLQELKERGVKLSIDDFGTGYSSLSYLRHFPVYKLKIDRTFIQSMTENPDDAAITATIINMAKTLNLSVIAEGVETEQQMLFLRAHDCDEFQGYYFSKPLAAGDFVTKLRSTPFRQSDLHTATPDLLGKRWAKLQLARKALSYSTRNSHITMEVFLLDDRRLIDPLLADRANNTQLVSELAAKLEDQCDSEQERRLLATVNNSRAPYVASYLKALHLLLDEGQQEAARAIMIQESTPALFRYHDAWNTFIQFQMEETDKAANQSRSLATRRKVPLSSP